MSSYLKTGIDGKCDLYLNQTIFNVFYLELPRNPRFSLLQIINISDFTLQKQFKATSNVEPDFTIQSVLCQPIYNSEQKIIGVAQMMNKAGKQTFTEQDENIFEVSQRGRDGEV